MKILHTINKFKLWLLGLLIPVAFAATLVLPENADIKAISVDEKDQILDENTTVTKKTLNLQEASGTEELDGFIPEQKNIVTEFTYKGATYTVTIDFMGYNGCRDKGFSERFCTSKLVNQIKENIRWTKEMVGGQVKPTDFSNEITISDLNLVK